MHSSFMHRLFWGIVPIAVGVVFLLNHVGIIDMSLGEFFSTFWPAFLIFFGLQGMLLQNGVFWWNPLLILIGFFFLGRNLNWFSMELSDVMPLVWPVALILFGFSMIFKGKRKRRRTREPYPEDRWNPITPPPMREAPSGPPPAPPAYDELDSPAPSAPHSDSVPPPPRPPHVHEAGWKTHHQEKEHWKAYKHDWKDPRRQDYSRFIGDVHMGNDYWELRPMSISHFIGDTMLDLTKAQIPMGETRIYVSAFIGDVKIFVPNDMSVGIQVSSSCLIGDVKVLDQKREGLFNHMTVETPYYADTDKRVVLVVSCFIGDVRISKVG
jgi:lia operon protein LiaF